LKIWITGIGGLIGSHVADACLARGDVVMGNDSLICGDKANVPRQAKFIQLGCQEEPGAVWRKNLWEEMKAFKPDVVLHAAATAAEGYSVFSPHFITKNIAEASVATFSAAISARAKRIVYLSSMARYGKGKPPFKEIDPVTPVDSYGLAKVYAEEQLKNLCGFHKTKWSILVPHNVCGPRQEITPYRNVISIFLNCLKRDKPIYIYGDGEQKRCFSPIGDCVDSILKVIDGKGDGEVINIGPDRGEITINHLADLCEHVVGKKTKRIYLEARPLTDSVKNAYCSSDKARQLLGYEPKQNYIDCIKQTSDAMKPKEFEYRFPLEIVTTKTPRTWSEKLM